MDQPYYRDLAGVFVRFRAPPPAHHPAFSSLTDFCKTAAASGQRADRDYLAEDSVGSSAAPLQIGSRSRLAKWISTTPLTLQIRRLSRCPPENTLTTPYVA
jgi:hypothetical protein